MTEKILIAVREQRQVFPKGMTITLTAKFSTVVEATRQQNKIIEVLRAKN